MLGIVCSVLLAIVGALLVVAGGYLGFDFLPRIVNEQIIENVILEDDTIQLERFLVTPVALHFKVTLFNITNPELVMQGQPAHLQEVGPYIYWQHKRKDVIEIEENTITYREFTTFEFDAEASYPLTEEDLVTVLNVPYNAILQRAEITNPGLMVVLNPLLNQVFGAANNRPIFTTPVGDLLFHGVRMCQNPNFLGQVACNPIREGAADSENMIVYEDGSFSFSFFYHKHSEPTKIYTVDRGLLDPYDLGRILFYDEHSDLSIWPPAAEESEEVSICNMINGTDSAIYRPFINISEPLQAFNPDICRSVELYYQNDTEYEGIPAIRFVSGPSLLSGEEECWCLGDTRGVTQENGCLYPGVMELYACTDSHMVFSSPHFLHADSRYRLGVLGLNPVEENHQIFLELEPNSGTILRGAKRAQFNMFLRPISSITGTNNLSPTLTPVLWVEDGMNLPEELVDEVKSTLLRPLRLIAILRIVAIVLGAILILLGVWLTVRLCRARNDDDDIAPTPTELVQPGKENKDSRTPAEAQRPARTN